MKGVAGMSQFTLTPPFRNTFYQNVQTGGRLYVRPNVYLPNGEIDSQTGMVMEAQRRTGRTQALRREAHQLDAELIRLQETLRTRANEKGRRISMKAAVVLVLSVFVLFSVILLVQQGNIMAKETVVRQIADKSKNTQAVISDIQGQIDAASDPVQVCYIAARELDMVPGESAQAIFLTAMSTRPNQEPIAIRAGLD